MIMSDLKGVSGVVGIKEPPNLNTAETTTHTKPNGNVNTPDKRLSGELVASSRRSNIITHSACTSDGSFPKIAAISTVSAASGNSVVSGPTYVENQGDAQTESESPAKLQGNRRGRCGKYSANKVKFEEKEDMGLKALEGCARDSYGRHWGIDP